MWMVAFGGVILNSQVGGVIFLKRNHPGSLGFHDPIWWAYVSDGLLQPPTRKLPKLVHMDIDGIVAGNKESPGDIFFSKAWRNAKSGLQQIHWYCWWFRNPIPNHLECTNLVNHGIDYLPIGAQDLFHQLYHSWHWRRKITIRLGLCMCQPSIFLGVSSRFVLVRCWVSVLF